MEKIKSGIETLKLSKNRMDIIEKNGVTIINDCYNANFDSMKAAIEVTSKMSGDRKIAILGDMLELGEYSKELHEKVGIEVVKNKIDILITVGEEAKYIAKKAENEGMPKNQIYVCDNNQEAIIQIEKIKEKQDVILVKASNSMKFVEIVNSLTKSS